MSQFRNVVVVFNPAAQTGRLAHLEPNLKDELHATFGSVRFHCTEYKGHARELAMELGAEVDLVLAVGGDGTVHEVGTGLVEVGSRVPMGILPLGSGNDFARALKMPMEWKEAISALSTGTLRTVDTGYSRWKEEGKTRECRFINALGVGFDAFCAVIAPKYKGWPFGIGYTVSILVALKSWISSGATVWNLSNGKEPIFSGRMMFTTIGNAQDSGGGYSINPKALVSDGRVDACVVENCSIMRSLSLLPATREGKHLTMKEVNYHQLEKMLIDTDRGLPIHADGEVQSLEARSIEVSVVANSLRVIVPKSAPEVL
ncbi:MAG TPA: hypothetical protein DCY57_11055 [Bacteroidetes bacterium]|nr:hypothetical protein [Bacteroidota bacterium]